MLGGSDPGGRGEGSLCFCARGPSHWSAARRSGGSDPERSGLLLGAWIRDLISLSARAILGVIPIPRRCRWRLLGVRLATRLVCALGAASCGGRGGSPKDSADVLQTLRDGSQALLRGDAVGACRLLSRAGMTEVLNYQMDFLPSGTPVPTRQPGIPQTCPAIVRRVLALEASNPGALANTLLHGRFEIRSLSAGHAQVVLHPTTGYTYPVTFTLSKGSDDWRIDSCTCAPDGY